MSDKKNLPKEEDKPQKEAVVDFENLYKRALADYQNLQKQTAKEKEEFARYVKANLILEFIPIYEHLKTAIAHADEKNHDQWLAGVQYVIKQFEDMLANNGVEVINPLNEPFNPAEHEAVEKEEIEDEKQVNTVAKVVKTGYKIGDKVIQAAKVVVYSEKK
ncbi:nucleotide exchange factor GrpE [Candidatus Falkowbacteria bacterium RIFOXYC2_FULL_47_12]|uniref:Protein GrpE n=2 Tax=Candidatus Falkowiibacteriota TaxID=1752728 RepID=A0A1F5TNI8_9BACT|nr:MAG: nucleotide exchange factor GrpE [Candidatus Falkowbacteria bacterium RIFOXYA2_FULL_47_9]OGF40071.1 MAG: nucleotide exchange factor GrpE [Candidatus Falkowbacteria bacterium RIFOXYC2_FULL_47_12]